jgi:hypothetical protein
MNIVPSLVEGYLYSEMYHLEGGQMSGGFPLQDVVSSGGTMVGGGQGFANLVVPIGLVCDMRVAPKHIEYVNDYDDESVPFMDETLHDSLFGNVTSRKNGSRKTHFPKSSKRKSIRIKKQ